MKNTVITDRTAHRLNIFGVILFVLFFFGLISALFLPKLIAFLNHYPILLVVGIFLFLIFDASLFAVAATKTVKAGFISFILLLILTLILVFVIWLIIKLGLPEESVQWIKVISLPLAWGLMILVRRLLQKGTMKD